MEYLAGFVETQDQSPSVRATRPYNPQRLALTPGTRLGPYEVTAQIGVGGMGEVYKARDTRLDRTVAIKVLPEHVASDPDLKQRFEREAKTISSLNHPHICTLYDVGSQNRIDFLVMEHLEGETLEQRLKKGALPLDQALQTGIQIADALAAAHRAGIVHRDLKPGNIMLTKSGAKLLDFGLAKNGPSVVVDNASMLPTTPPHLTVKGTILGTFQYMAPEQLEGREADPRTDVFAFGAVLFEMLTGTKALQGESQATLIAAILDRDPPSVSSVQPLAPPVLDRVVRKCLDKDPERRWQSAADLHDELSWIAAGGNEALRSRAVPSPSRRGRLTLWAAVFLLGVVAASAAVWLLMRGRTPQNAPITRFVLGLPQGDQLVEGGVAGGSQVAVSPDGRYVAYVAARGTTQQIFMRAMDAADAKPIPGTVGGGAPFFSPDGQWLGFVAASVFSKVPVAGGPVERLGVVLIGGSAWPKGSWSQSGTIALAQGSGPIVHFESGGSAALPLVPLAAGEAEQLWPEFLPDGDTLLFTSVRGDARSVAAYSITKGERSDFRLAGTSPRYAQSGHLLFVQNGTLMAVPFDPVRLQVTGSATSVAQNVLQNAGGPAYFDISDTGTLAYVSGGLEQSQRKLVWVNRDGSTQDLSAPLREYDWPQLSPNGERIAVEIGPQIWVYDLVRDTLTPFTFDGSLNQAPVWTPDGERIVFNSNHDGDGSRNLFWQPADGSGGMEKLSSSDSVQVAKSWSEDGRLLAFHQASPTTIRDIWVWRASDRKAEPFLRTRFTEGAPSFSPDGRWLAYVSDESGGPQIYVQPYPSSGGKWQISTDGGTEPAWNRNGRELFYRNGDKMMAVSVSTQSGFAPGKPSLLFEGEYVNNPFPLTGIAYDISSDGKRFLMTKEVQQLTSQPQINVVQNWFEELKRLVPTN